LQAAEEHRRDTLARKAAVAGPFDVPIAGTCCWRFGTPSRYRQRAALVSIGRLALNRWFYQHSSSIARSPAVACGSLSSQPVAIGRARARDARGSELRM